MGDGGQGSSRQEAIRTLARRLADPTSWVKLGQMLDAVRSRGEWRAWDFSSFAAFCDDVGLKKSAVSDMINSSRYLAERNVDIEAIPAESRPGYNELILLCRARKKGLPVDRLEQAVFSGTGMSRQEIKEEIRETRCLLRPDRRPKARKDEEGALTAEVAELKQQLLDREARIAELEELLAQRDARVAALEAQVAPPSAAPEPSDSVAVPPNDSVDADVQAA